MGLYSEQTTLCAMTTIDPCDDLVVQLFGLHRVPFRSLQALALEFILVRRDEASRL